MVLSLNRTFRSGLLNAADKPRSAAPRCRYARCFSSGMPNLLYAVISAVLSVAISSEVMLLPSYKSYKKLRWPGKGPDTVRATNRFMK